MKWRELMSASQVESRSQYSRNSQNAAPIDNYANTANNANAENDASARTAVEPVAPPILEDIEERAAIFEYEAAEDPEAANLDAVRLVQCRTCRHFTANPNTPLAGLGRCAVDGPAQSFSPHRIHRGLVAWPTAPEYCGEWRDASGVDGE